MFFCVWMGNAQVQCPTINNPSNGALNVPVDTEVSWTTVAGINGYSVSLGASPGSSEILNSRSAALVNSLIPLVGLPANTKIFVTISLFLENGSFITCPSESFTTEDVDAPPPCTSLSTPMNNITNVGPSGDISWQYAPTATSYRLTIGTSAGGSEILPEIDVGNVLIYNPRENLPTNTEIFVRITPYNKIGDAEICFEEHFITGNSNIDCEMFLPEISIPETIGFCGAGSQITISSDYIAEGYRWYKINSDNTEVLISEMNTVTISDIAPYRFESYNNVSILGDNAECANSRFFTVVRSEPASVERIEVSIDPSGLGLEVLVSGLGNYEYSLDNEDGPFQDSNIFTSVSKEDHLIYVRDKNGCGTIEYVFNQTLTKEDFPQFFTPNSDGINDYWQFHSLYENIANLDTTYIFDRHGNLLSQVSPESRGWDGTFNGKSMPSSTYWYKAISKSGRGVQGYFVLKR